MTAAEAQELVNAAKHYPHLKVMEAFMYRMHPQWQRARQLVKEGAVGELRTIHSFFSYYLDDPTNIRNILEAGGGTMMVETRLHSTIESDRLCNLVGLGAQ